jgi:hypothetical protein
VAYCHAEYSFENVLHIHVYQHCIHCGRSINNLFGRLITDSEGGAPVFKPSGGAAELDGAVEEHVVVNPGK